MKNTRLLILIICAVAVFVICVIVLRWWAITARAQLYVASFPKVGPYTPPTASTTYTTSTNYTHPTVTIATKATPPPKTSWLAQRKIIFFLHLHKSGGTSICGAAHAEHERASGHNCNVQSDQRCCGGETEEEQTRFALQTKYTFVASEGYMYREMNTKHYMYITSLRMSLYRYLSHYQHVLRAYRKVTATFDEWMHGQPDNWNTRHICGTRCVLVPKYGLSAADFMFAAQRLANFSHIIFMHNFDASFTKMARDLSWRIAIPPQSNVARHYPPIQETPGTRAMTFLDDLLYEYARDDTLSNFSVATVRHAIATMTPADAQNYSLACGLVCSKY